MARVRSNFLSRCAVLTAAASVLAIGGSGTADDMKCPWYTVAGGGEMYSAGGEFVLGATLSQHSADTLAGGEFTLAGGFWNGIGCMEAGDLTGDGRLNGADIQQFVQCILGGSGDCDCADIDENGKIDTQDIGLFVSCVLGNSPPAN